MIVVNGVLVLVALVLLVVGLAGDGLTVVYASIAVSVLALLSLLVGVLERRGPAVGGTPAASPSAAPVAGGAPGRPLVAPAPAPAVAPAAATAMERDDELLDDEEEFGGLVAVAPGAPRYHVDGCPELAGQRVQELDVLDAREEGYTPCGTCRPDAALAGQAEQRSLAEVRAGATSAQHTPELAAAPPPVAGPGHAGTLDDGAVDQGDLDADADLVEADAPQSEDVPAGEPGHSGPGDGVTGHEADADPGGSAAGTGGSVRTPVEPAAPPLPVAAVRAVAGVARYIARDATTRGAAAARRRAAELQQRRSGGPAPTADEARGPDKG